MAPKTFPRKLYKYRAFNTKTLGLIVNAEAYYAKPQTFNDPLDCSPEIEDDISRSDMEKLFYRLLLSRSLPKDEAAGRVNTLRYMSTEYGDYRTDPEVDTYLLQMLSRDVREEVERDLGGKGVLSFSAVWDSPLMWSHYSEEHRGICIEFEVTPVRSGDFRAVDYNAGRLIKASDLRRWKVDGDDEARARVERTYFFAKAPQWRYEREWRHVTDDSGLTYAPFAISAIYFGFRCPDAVRVTIVKLLSSHKGIKLYDIRPYRDTFRFKRNLVERDEIEATGIRPTMAFFDPIDEADEEADYSPTSGA